MEAPPDAYHLNVFGFELGWIAFTWPFFQAVIEIILIDLVLAGDNAVVIALAVRNLPGKQRKWGIILGAGAAVVLRVICTAVVSQMLKIPLLKFAGGIAIFWIAVKLLTQGHEEEHVDSASKLTEAIKLIVIADFVMSLDNMLAVGGASKGNLFLLMFGLIVSIPFVVGTSALLSMLMDKYPIIVWIGAGGSRQGFGRVDHHGPVGGRHHEGRRVASGAHLERPFRRPADSPLVHLGREYRLHHRRSGHRQNDPGQESGPIRPGDECGPGGAGKQGKALNHKATFLPDPGAKGNFPRGKFPFRPYFLFPAYFHIISVCIPTMPLGGH